MKNVVLPDNLTNARNGLPNRNAMLPYNPGPSANSGESNYFACSFPLQFTPIGPNSKTPNNAITPNGQEALVLLLGRTLHAVQVSGTFIASVIVEVALDEATSFWKTLDTITTADIKQYSGIYFAMRIRISAYTSGNPLVTVLSQR